MYGHFTAYYADSRYGFLLGDCQAEPKRRRMGTYTDRQHLTMTYYYTNICYLLEAFVTEPRGSAYSALLVDLVYFT